MIAKLSSKRSEATAEYLLTAGEAMMINKMQTPLDLILTQTVQILKQPHTNQGSKEVLLETATLLSCLLSVRDLNTTVFLLEHHQLLSVIGNMF